MRIRSTWDRLAGMALLLLCVAFAALASFKSFQTAINYDEAYNLQVVDSLANGHGYSTYGAVRADSRAWFDPSISTGAAMLVPLAGVWSLSAGNLAAVQLALVLVFGVYAAVVVGQAARGGPFLLPAAMALAAALCIDHLPVGRVVGELPGAALLWLAGWACVRHKPVLAAVLAGLAVQTKLVYGLAGVIVLGSFVFYYCFLGARLGLGTVVQAAAAFVAPSVAFEVYRLIALGSVDSYGQSVAQLMDFLRIQKFAHADDWLAPQVLADKVAAVFKMWPRSVWLALVLSLAVFVPASLLVQAQRHPPDASHDPALRVDVMLACMALAGAAMLGGWVAQSIYHQDARQALPFALLAGPATVALAGRLLMRAARSTAGPQRLFGTVLSCVIALLLAHAVVVRARIVHASAPQHHLADRQAVMAFIRDYRPQTMFIDGWWQNPEYLLGTGLKTSRVRQCGRQIMVVQDYQVALLKSTWEAQTRPCAQVLYRSGFNLVCTVACEGEAAPPR